MGLTYRIHPEVQLLVIRGDGTISQQERPETLRAWMRDPDYPTCTAALCDFTNARSAPRLSELHELIQVMREDRSGRGPSKLAIVTRWCKDFDNWAVCDAMSFNLFDRSPHAWDKVAEWSRRDQEFEKRTAFALLWSLSVHDKGAANDAFLRGLELIEREAGDGRNFVKKATNMALRAIGKRNRALNSAAVTVARRLAKSDDASARWVGSDALRELTSPGVSKRLG